MGKKARTINLQEAIQDVRRVQITHLAEDQCGQVIKDVLSSSRTVTHGALRMPTINGQMLQAARAYLLKGYKNIHDNYARGAKALSDIVPQNANLLDVLSGNAFVPLALLHANRIAGLTMLDGHHGDDAGPTTGAAKATIDKLNLRKKTSIIDHWVEGGYGSIGLPEMRDVSLGFTGLPLPLQAREQLPSSVELAQLKASGEPLVSQAPHILEAQISLSDVLTELSGAARNVYIVDVPVQCTQEDVVAMVRLQLAQELEKSPRGWQLKGDVVKHNGSNIFLAELVND